MPISPDEHAARLRLIRRIGGMLKHPDCSLVMSEDVWRDIHDTVISLVEATCSLEDFHNHSNAGRDDLEVVWSEEKQKHLFRLKESRAQ